MSNLVRIHLAKVQGSIPQAKGSARRRSNDPVGLVSLYVCSSLFSVTSAAEVPWSAVRLHSAEVKCIEALEVERPTTVLSLFAYGPTSMKREAQSIVNLIQAGKAKMKKTDSS